MERISIAPRADWQRIVESQGFHFHSLDEANATAQPSYWDESVCYRFASSEIDVLEKATYELNDLCLKAVAHVIDQNLLGAFHIPPAFHEFVRASWESEEHTIYGRFDLAFDGVGPPKLIEYNADTPTALLEASVVQWGWFKDRYPTADQFNSIHERLLEAWSGLKRDSPETWYFTSLEGSLEDFITVNYLRDTAAQAGLATAYIPIGRIGWNANRRAFVDEQEQPMRHIFKLYPWEWLLREQFGPQLLECQVQWLEAPWKMLLANKTILPMLWELFPNSPYLLKAGWEPLDTDYARKPIFGREGANVTLVQGGQTLIETEGPYREGPFIYQELNELPSFDDQHVIVGSWLVNGYACGIGLREDSSPITQNTSRFVPHFISREQVGEPAA
jgi:glutathionylspermidine synthase